MLQESELICYIAVTDKKSNKRLAFRHYCLEHHLHLYLQIA